MMTVREVCSVPSELRFEDEEERRGSFSAFSDTAARAGIERCRGGWGGCSELLLPCLAGVARTVLPETVTEARLLQEK